MFPAMTLARRAAIVAAAAGAAGLVTACGTAAAPGAAPTKTVTATAAATGSPSAASSPSPTPAAAGGTTGAAAGPGACVSSDLQASIGQGGAAAGTFYQLIVLTNTSGSACTLYGYPGVSFVTGQGGAVIGAPATRNALIPDTLVTLSSGGTASALVGVADTGNFPPSVCKPGKADWLQIYPPGAFGALYVQLGSSVCTRPGEKFMTVTAVHAGSTNSF
jgi:Protein of unknown function (DUF4232)